MKMLPSIAKATNTFSCAAFRKATTVILLSSIPCFVFAQPHKSQSGNSKDGIGAFATKKYHNLFIEQGHSEKEIDAKINIAFQQLFHGDTATQAVYFSAGKNDNGPLSYVSDVPHNDIRSEGMSCGMMIAVQMDKKAEFAALQWQVSYLVSKIMHLMKLNKVVILL